MSNFARPCGRFGGFARASFLLLSALVMHQANSAFPDESRSTQEYRARTVADLTSIGVAGRTYYVAPNGNDVNSGATLDAPFRTLEHAASAPYWNRRP